MTLPPNKEPANEIAVSKAGQAGATYSVAGTPKTGDETLETQSLKSERGDDPLTELEASISEDQRRVVTVAGHHEFRESIASSLLPGDLIDDLVADLRAVELNREGGAQW